MWCVFQPWHAACRTFVPNQGPNPCPVHGESLWCFIIAARIDEGCNFPATDLYPAAWLINYHLSLLGSELSSISPPLQHLIAVVPIDVPWSPAHSLPSPCPAPANKVCLTVFNKCNEYFCLYQNSCASCSYAGCMWDTEDCCLPLVSKGGWGQVVFQ